jgi:basic amino acid/polyamine antiporter, APA family
MEPTPVTLAPPVAVREGEARLERTLGVRQLGANIFNYTVGSGIFALPAIAVAHLGGAAPLAYLVCTLVMALVLLCFAEAGSRVSLTGGVYAYVETALGPFCGFIAGAMLFFTGLSAAGAVAVLFAHTATRLVGLQGEGWARALIVLTLALLIVLNVRGLRGSARALEAITIAKLAPLVAFVLIGAFFIHPANLHWGPAPAVSNVLGTAGVVIFAFSGIESALAPSGEVRDPWRTVPRAAFFALGLATLLYLAIQWVALGIQGLRLGSDTYTPLADATAVFAGSAGRTVIIAAGAVSMLGYLSANVLSMPRGLFAYARDRFLPAALCSVHPRLRTPHVAVIVYGVLAMGVALSGTYENLTIFANLTAFVIYILAAIAVVVLRARNVHSEGPPFLIPGGPVIPILTCLINVWLIYATASRTDLIGLVVVVIIAFILYLFRALRLRRAA